MKKRTIFLILFGLLVSGVACGVGYGYVMDKRVEIRNNTIIEKKEAESDILLKEAESLLDNYEDIEGSVSENDYTAKIEETETTITVSNPYYISTQSMN